MKILMREALIKIKKGLMVTVVEHIPIFILVLLYLGYAFYIEYRLGNWNILNIKTLLPDFITFLMLCTLLGLFFVLFVVRVIKNDIPGLRGKCSDIVSKYLKFKCIGGFILIYSLLPITISIFESLKKSIPLVQPFAWDVIFMKLDYIFHFHKHPWMFLSLILQHSTLVQLIDRLYIAWFLILHFITFWLAWTLQRKIRMQFFLCNILILFFIGNLLAAVFSSAGPCYYAKVEGVMQDNPYKPLMDKLAVINKKDPLIALTLQKQLWNNYICQNGDYCMYISAMPSVHVAFATLFALTISSISFPLGLIFWGYWAVVQIGSIILGWHYAIDGYFATLVTLGLWRISSYVSNCFWDKLPEKMRSQILNPNGEHCKKLSKVC